MLLTGWVANPRPLGCPQMTWGRTLKKALSSHGLPTDFAAWHQLAADKCTWRQFCGGGVSWPDTKRHQGQAGLSGRTSGMAPRKPSESLYLLRDRLTCNQPNRRKPGEQQKQTKNTHLRFF